MKKLYAILFLVALIHTGVYGQAKKPTIMVSGRSEALLPLSPLRTVLDSFPSYGSSISKFNSHKLNRLNSLSLRSCPSSVLV